MPHAIIRGKNGRRHEVDFGVPVETYSTGETVDIYRHMGCHKIGAA
jgi:hypothetical protein